MQLKNHLSKTIENLVKQKFKIMIACGASPERKHHTWEWYEKLQENLQAESRDRRVNNKETMDKPILLWPSKRI